MFVTTPCRRAKSVPSMPPSRDLATYPGLPRTPNRDSATESTATAVISASPPNSRLPAQHDTRRCNQAPADAAGRIFNFAIVSYWSDP